MGCPTRLKCVSTKRAMRMHRVFVDLRNQRVVSRVSSAYVPSPTCARGLSPTLESAVTRFATAAGDACDAPTFVARFTIFHALPTSVIVLACPTHLRISAERARTQVSAANGIHPLLLCRLPRSLRAPHTRGHLSRDVDSTASRGRSARDSCPLCHV